MYVGIDLGGTNIRAAIEENGNLHKLRKNFFKTNDSLENTIQEFKDFIRPLIEPGVEGIGIGVPSVVDVENGIVYNVTNIPSWERVPLKDILEDEFSVPVAVNNDVNCFALGEHRFGVARGFQNVVGMTSGTGLGCGIIIRNELFAGSNCGAGEIGLVQYGNHNIEYYASGNFFEAVHGISARTAHDQAIGGDQQALALWSEFGVHMGQAIKTVVYAYDPEAIVIGGSLSKAFRFFEESMKACLNDFVFPRSIKRLRIMQSTDENITLLGAAALLPDGHAHHEEARRRVMGG